MSISNSSMQHLFIIQDVVKRMANNSLILKIMAMVLFCMFLAIAYSIDNARWLVVLHLPLAVLWVLDAFYLQQERLYRALYDKVRKLPEHEVDFDMRASPKEFTDTRNQYQHCFLSKTLLWYYGAIIVSYICIMLSVV